MNVAEEQNKTDSSYRLVLPPDLRRAWIDLVESKKITQQAAFEALVRFLLSQDDLAQSAILTQVKLTPKILRIIYHTAAMEKLPERRKSG